jgi:uridine kinase
MIIQKPYIIGVCGRSCSGKSTVVSELERRVSDVLHIQQDKFFKIPDAKYQHWETPDVLRNDRLIYSIKKLKNNQPTHIPSHRWTEIFDKQIYPKKYIIVEGYLLFAVDELYSLFDKRIWVDVSDVNMLYRRLKRDGNINGIDATMNPVIYQSKKYEPIQRSRANIIIDGNQSKSQIVEEFRRKLNI